MKIASALLIILGLVESKVSLGKCPYVEYMGKRFDQRRYVGQWYNIESDKTNRYNGYGVDCNVNEFQMNRDGNMDLYFSARYWGRTSGSGGTVYDCDTGMCQATMGRSSYRSNFKIFDTDYDSYAISYSCYERYGMKYESYNMASRTPTITPEEFARVRNIVAQKLPFYMDYISNDSNIYKTKQGSAGQCNYSLRLKPLETPQIKQSSSNGANSSDDQSTLQGIEGTYSYGSTTGITVTKNGNTLEIQFPGAPLGRGNFSNNRGTANLLGGTFPYVFDPQAGTINWASGSYIWVKDKSQNRSQQSQSQSYAQNPSQGTSSNQGSSVQPSESRSEQQAASNIDTSSNVQSTFQGIEGRYAYGTTTGIIVTQKGNTIEIQFPGAPLGIGNINGNQGTANLLGGTFPYVYDPQAGTINWASGSYIWTREKSSSSSNDQTQSQATSTNQSNYVQPTATIAQVSVPQSQLLVQRVNEDWQSVLQTCQIEYSRYVKIVNSKFSKIVCPKGIVIVGDETYPDWQLEYAAKTLDSFLDPKQLQDSEKTEQLRKILSSQSGIFLGGSSSPAREQEICDRQTFQQWEQGCFGLKSNKSTQSNQRLDSSQLYQNLLSNKFHWLEDGQSASETLTFKPDGQIYFDDQYQPKGQWVLYSNRILFMKLNGVRQMMQFSDDGSQASIYSGGQGYYPTYLTSKLQVVDQAQSQLTDQQIKDNMYRSLMNFYMAGQSKLFGQ